MKTTKTILAAALLIAAFAITPLHADDRTIWGWSETAGFSMAFPAAYTPFKVDGSSVLAGSVAIPAFRWGNGILFDSNYLRLAASVEVSSTNLDIANSITFEPLAFLHLKAGSSLGTGWTIGNGPYIGLAINPSNDAEAIRPIPNGGYVWSAWGSIPLSFSIEQLTGNAWLRIVLETEPRMQYRALNVAGKLDAWLWRSDQGMNFNGWTLSQSFFVGYRPPLYYGPQEAGFELTYRTWLFDVADSSTVANNGWGSDAVMLDFAFRAKWSFDAWSKLFFRVNVGTEVEWTAASVAAHRYFGNRTYLGKGTVWGLEASYIYEY